jgi:hypothetical protein
MLVNEEDFDSLVEAVDNSQMRLADTFMLRVLAQLIDSVEEISQRVNLMYEFMSEEDDSAELSTTQKTEQIKSEVQNIEASELPKEDKATKQPVAAKSKKIEEETKIETQSE